jgi:Asp-tRNA(Asn)/Glu-tRNA(Gln) amidotransferase A subunit family amidase
MDNPSQLGALEAARLIKAGELTSEALVRSCLARIEARDNDVGAWTALDPDRAIAEARARDSESPRSFMAFHLVSKTLLMPRVIALRWALRYMKTRRRC